MIAPILLLSAAGYLLLGLAFAILFVPVGVGKINPHAAHGSWSFRVVIFPELDDIGSDFATVVWTKEGLWPGHRW